MEGPGEVDMLGLGDAGHSSLGSVFLLQLTALRPQGLESDVQGFAMLVDPPGDGVGVMLDDGQAVGCGADALIVLDQTLHLQVEQGDLLAHGVGLLQDTVHGGGGRERGLEKHSLLGDLVQVIFWSIQLCLRFKVILLLADSLHVTQPVPHPACLQERRTQLGSNKQWDTVLFNG